VIDGLGLTFLRFYLIILAPGFSLIQICDAIGMQFGGAKHMAAAQELVGLRPIDRYIVYNEDVADHLAGWYLEYRERRVRETRWANTAPHPPRTLAGEHSSACTCIPTR